MRPSPAAIVLVLSAAGGATGATAACGDSLATPLGSGNSVYKDVEASVSSEPPPEDAGASSRYGRGYDTYPARVVCGPAGGADGGALFDADASPYRSSGDDSGGADARAAYGGFTEGGTQDGGCESFPSVCVNTPSCECLLNTLALELPCRYPHCAVNLDKSGFTIYCPR